MIGLGRTRTAQDGAAGDYGLAPVGHGITGHSGSKYVRQAYDCVTGRLCQVDVYAVLGAFGVTCPARQHAIKKLLCSGLRGKGGELQDLRECRDAVSRAIEMQETRENPEKEIP